MSHENITPTAAASQFAAENARLRQQLESVLRALVQSDDYLRSIRSEELDGSEPALGELLEDNLQVFAAIGLAAPAANGAREPRPAREGQ